MITLIAGGSLLLVIATPTVAPLVPLEAVHPIWFEDEARVGRKNKITRRWARRGSRPSAPSDQRTASAYIFGAICPAQGKAVGLSCPGATPKR